MLADGFFSRLGLEEAFRWLHILAGIAWIGLLYFFNLVQVPAYAAFGDEGRARNIALDKVTRRALWWFRWAAVATVVMGIFIIGATKNYFGDNFGTTSRGLMIELGNDCADDLTVVGLTALSAEAQFTPISEAPLTVAAGDGGVVGISFAPLAAGDFVGYIALDFEAAAGLPPFVITVRGRSP